MVRNITLVAVFIVILAGCAGSSGPSAQTTQTATPTPPDSDGDGLTDPEEEQYGTNPNKADTDGDKLNDRKEIQLGTEPSNPDTDGDGITDGKENVLNTDPTAPDTDGDGVADSTDICPITDAKFLLQVTFLSASNSDAPFIDGSDPYLVISLDSQQQQTDFLENPEEVENPFSVSMKIPDDKSSYQLAVQMWDEDTRWDPNDPDDQLDILADSPKEMTWVKPITLSKGKSTKVTTEGGGDSDDDVDGLLEFTARTNC